ncbi:MAG: NAD-binding protein [Euryarchaeota archaeon]|nr:NAD-binding protein [Euryarchaeota archaeon]
MYAILGCGTVGHSVADLLEARGKEVLIVERSAERVESLRERGFDANVYDILDIEAYAEHLEDVDTVLILTKNDETNLETLKRIKARFPHIFTVVRASNAAMVEEMGEEGADYVVESAELISNAVVKDLTEIELQKKTDRLVGVIEAAGDKGVAIFTHNSPDPDCIASAIALQKIAEKINIKGHIYYSGRIGHQQNRSLVNLLGVEMTAITDEKDVLNIIDRHGKVAILDTEYAGQNNPLPRDFVPNIVIGHHETPEEVPGEYVDVRTNVGAVSTILWSYLMELSITPDAPLATALLHAIRVDTAAFTRKTSPMDLKALAYLSPLTDTKLLEEIENPPMSPETFDILGRSIANRTVRGSYLASSVGFISDRDALPQAADFLLRLEGIATVLVFGILENEIQISARSNDSRVNLGKVLQEAFGRTNAGGHAQAAGAQIPLGIMGDVDDREELLALVESVVTKQFFSSVGAAADERDREREREKEKERAAAEREREKEREKESVGA